jgi:hypothetical protein
MDSFELELRRKSTKTEKICSKVETGWFSWNFAFNGLSHPFQFGQKWNGENTSSVFRKVNKTTALVSPCYRLTGTFYFGFFIFPQLMQTSDDLLGNSAFRKVSPLLLRF